MTNEFNKDLQQVIETKFEIINLKLQANKIRNSQNLQEGLAKLIEFVGGRKRAIC